MPLAVRRSLVLLGLALAGPPAAYAGKPVPEAEWAAAQGLPPVKSKSESAGEWGGVQLVRVELLHTDGSTSVVFRRPSGQQVGPVTRDNLEYVTARGPMVAMRPAGPAGDGLVIVDRATAESTPTRATRTTRAGETRLLLAPADDHDGGDAALLSDTQILWHVQGLAPRTPVQARTGDRLYVLLTTAAGARLYSDGPEPLLALDDPCPVSFLDARPLRLLVSCPDATRVVGEDGATLFRREGHVYRGLLAVHNPALQLFEARAGRFLVLPQDLSGPGVELPGRPRALSPWLWVIDLPEVPGQPFDVALLDPVTLRYDATLVGRPLYESRDGKGDFAPPLRGWRFFPTAPTARPGGFASAVFVRHSTPAGPRWGLVGSGGVPLVGAVWRDVRVERVTFRFGAVEGLSEAFASRTVYLVQDDEKGMWIRIGADGQPTADALPHPTPEAALAAVEAELRAHYTTWKASNDAQALHRRYLEARGCAAEVLAPDARPGAGAVQLSWIAGEGFDPGYDDDGQIRKALARIARADPGLTAHQYATLGKAAAVLERHYDGKPGPTSTRLHELQAQAEARDEARLQAQRDAALDWSWPEPYSTPPPQPVDPAWRASPYDGGWGSGWAAQQAALQDRSFDAWVYSVDRFLGNK